MKIRTPESIDHSYLGSINFKESIVKTTSGDASRNTVSNREVNKAVVDEKIK